jgi:hypothetical protein
MYTGTLIADLFDAVKRAEKAAADPFSAPKTKDAARHSVEADSQRYAKEELNSE